MRKIPVAIMIFFCLSFHVRSAQEAQVEKIEIKSHWGGLGTESDSAITIRNDGKSYRRGVDKIAQQRVKAFVRALEATPVVKPDLANLGITEAWLKSVVNTATTKVFWNDSTPAQKTSFVSSFTNMDLILKVVPSLYTYGSIDNYPTVDVLVTLKDGSTISSSSDSCYEFMLPWKVVRGGEKIETYNADISRALVELMPKKMTNRRLVSGKGLDWDLAEAVKNYIQAH